MDKSENINIEDKENLLVKKMKNAFKKSNDFELAKQELIRRSEKRGWLCFYASLSVVAALSLTIYGMMPLKKTEYHLLSVDRNTGQTELVTILDKKEISTNSASNSFWVSSYIRYRESYSYMSLSDDLAAVELLSTDTVFSKHYDNFQGENALHSKLGDKFEYDVSILSIVPHSHETYQVRFNKTKRLASSSDVIDSRTWVATVAFDYQPKLELTTGERLINPLGFQVHGYKINPEL